MLSPTRSSAGSPPSAASTASTRRGSAFCRPACSKARSPCLKHGCFMNSVTAIARRRPRSAAALSLDAGYLSRLLQNLEKRGLVRRTPSPADRRTNLLALTPAGHQALLPLEKRAQDEIAMLLKPLSEVRQRALLAAMETIKTNLGSPPTAAPTAFCLRPHRIGDMGWVASRHGALYAEEYGWNGAFEAFVAGLAAKFVTRFDPARERCWIAEVEGEPVEFRLPRPPFEDRRPTSDALRRAASAWPRDRQGTGRSVHRFCASERLSQSDPSDSIAASPRPGISMKRPASAWCKKSGIAAFGKRLVGQNWALDLKPATPAQKKRRRSRKTRRRSK